MLYWIQEALLALLLWLAGFLLGGICISWTVGIVLGLVCYLAYAFIQMARLRHWSRHPSRSLPPSAPALWGRIFDGLYRYQRLERRRRNQLHHVISRFDRLSEALNDGMIVLDERDGLDSWNAAAEHILGLHTPKDRGQHITNLLRHPRFVEYFNQRAYDEPLTLRSPHDESRWLQFQIIPYGNDERLVVVRDITRLQRLQEMRRDFVANVSHELRTPLTVFTGYLEPLAAQADSLLPPRMLRGIEQMHQQSERMRHLIDDLLMLSRLENEHAHSPHLPVDVAALLQRAHDDGVALSQQRQTFSVVIESRQGLLGDLQQLQSALINLVSNAVRYSGQHCHITLGWRVDEQGQGQLWVEDDGEGIEEHHLSRLTERFYRVDKGRSSATGGTGLGLAIVKHVMLHHQGWLKITSVLGKGSCFTLCFPSERIGPAQALPAKD